MFGVLFIQPQDANNLFGRGNFTLCKPGHPLSVAWVCEQCGRTKFRFVDNRHHWGPPIKSFRFRNAGIYKKQWWFGATSKLEARSGKKNLLKTTSLYKLFQDAFGKGMSKLSCVNSCWVCLKVLKTLRCQQFQKVSYISLNLSN